MNILYIAYSCSPNHGSEDRIGWMVPMYGAKHNRVWVITKEEHRPVIEAYRRQHLECAVQFQYVDIPAPLKTLFRGAAYAGRLWAWQKRALTAARELCRREPIELIHQITPVEFRSIADYGSIPGVKFVCGPVGGGERIPKGLAGYARRHGMQEWLRQIINRISARHLRHTGILSRCDALLFANRETQNLLDGEGLCMTETGIEDCEIGASATKGPGCTFLAAGRMVYRKGHKWLLDALREMPPELEYECIFAGWGPERRRLERLCRRWGLEHRVRFLDRVSYDQMERLYQTAHVLVMPSLRETTGSVLLEAMARGLPVITLNRFGGAVVADETTGWLISGNSRREYVHSLRDACCECIRNPAARAEKGRAALIRAREHTWEAKTARYMALYRRLLGGD